FKKSLWLTIFILGWFTSNHFGTCPHVTKCILLTHGAYSSTPLNQYCKLSQSLNLISLLSPDCWSCSFLSLCHLGSLPSTHNKTKSILLSISLSTFINVFLELFNN